MFCLFAQVRAFRAKRNTSVKALYLSDICAVPSILSEQAMGAPPLAGERFMLDVREGSRQRQTPCLIHLF